MPAYPFLFKQKTQAEDADVVVQLPPGQAPPGQVIIARQEALDLVKYLQAMNRTYPAISPAPATPASSEK